MEDFELRPVERTNLARLNAINRACPIEADFTVLFDRGDDFFAWPDAVYDQYQYIGAYFCGELVGYLMVGLFGGWTGADYGLCGYLGDARVLPRFRGKHLTHRMLNAIEAVVPSGLKMGMFIVKKGNVRAESLTASVQSAAYAHRRLGDLKVLNVPLLRLTTESTRFTVRNAQRQDLAAMAALFNDANRGKLFAPRMTADRLEQRIKGLAHLGLRHYWLAERRGRLVGMLAAWDMHPIHFTRVLGFSPKGHFLRLLYNSIAMLNSGAAPLPKPGGDLRALTLTYIAIEDQNPVVLRALLASVMRVNLRHGYHLLNLGFAGDDPLLEATEGFPLVQHFVSSLYCITPASEHRQASTGPVYVDLAMI